MNKTVDKLINSMKDGKFYRFAKGFIDSIHKKRGCDPYNDSKEETNPLVS